MEVLFTRRSFFYKMHVNSKRIRLTLLCARTDNEMKLLKKKKKLLQYEKWVKLKYLFYPSFKQDDSIMYITSMTIK